MTVNDLLKLFPEESEVQINVIQPDNHCTYFPCPHFVLGGNGYREMHEKEVASLDVEQFTEENKTIALLVIGVKE